MFMSIWSREVTVLGLWHLYLLEPYDCQNKKQTEEFEKSVLKSGQMDLSDTSVARNCCIIICYAQTTLQDSGIELNRI